VCKSRPHNAGDGLETPAHTPPKPIQGSLACNRCWPISDIGGLLRCRSNGNDCIRQLRSASQSAPDRPFPVTRDSKLPLSAPDKTPVLARGFSRQPTSRAGPNGGRSTETLDSVVACTTIWTPVSAQLWRCSRGQRRRVLSPSFTPTGKARQSRNVAIEVCKYPGGSVSPPSTASLTSVFEVASPP
jgi:hypothetical protein